MLSPQDKIRLPAAACPLPATPPTPLASRNNKKFSNREVLGPMKQATAMKIPSKTPGSPRDFRELSRLANKKTGNFSRLAKMRSGTFSLVTKMSWGIFFTQTGNFPKRPAGRLRRRAVLLGCTPQTI